MNHSVTREQLTLCMEPTREEKDLVAAQVAGFNLDATDGRFNYPGKDDPGLAFSLAIRSPRGEIVGGVNVSSVLGVMWLEVLWVAEEYRRHGLAGWLVLEAERIAHEKGCVGAGTWTFNWQGAPFYPTIGYRLNGIHDGYPFGITEHVLSKRLPDLVSQRRAEKQAKRLMKEGFSLVAAPTEDEMRVVDQGLETYCRRHAGEEYSYPGLALRPVVKNPQGEVVGGLMAYTVIRVLALEGLWIDERYRGQGHGRRLLTEIEQLAKDRGCVAVNSHCLSCQSPGFFRKLGYGTFGKVDVYMDGYTEDLLIKKL